MIMPWSSWFIKCFGIPYFAKIEDQDPPISAFLRSLLLFLSARRRSKKKSCHQFFLLDVASQTSTRTMIHNHRRRLIFLTLSLYLSLSLSFFSPQSSKFQKLSRASKIRCPSLVEGSAFYYSSISKQAYIIHRNLIFSRRDAKIETIASLLPLSAFIKESLDARNIVSATPIQSSSFKLIHQGFSLTLHSGRFILMVFLYS